MIMMGDDDDTACNNRVIYSRTNRPKAFKEQKLPVLAKVKK